ncbi:Indoleacetaldoxime dehydratase [Platanthera guangdongensis]|uniref:Indoleacetaldoxime dehydratase n=1 Tax=Platanthera guangdongensis TaxID=2320717 RepID=A0ABR2MEC3_9ASPA
MVHGSFPCCHDSALILIYSAKELSSLAVPRGQSCRRTASYHALGGLSAAGVSSQWGAVTIRDLILGGTETTSAILEWTMAELIRHPEVMRKAQSEVRNAFRGRPKYMKRMSPIFPT